MKQNELILGLDIGVASVGWALADKDGRQIEAAGVRIFEPAMDAAKFESGGEGASHAVERRRARLQRRQLRRRAARHRDLYLALYNAGLLPPAGVKAEKRHEVLTKLDRELMDRWRPKIRELRPDIVEPDQVLCYFLRAHALREKIGEFELGRALYHLGQRRGFKSNRREGRPSAVGAEGNAEAEKSEIKATIQSLATQLKESGETLGQHFVGTDPHRSAVRNRKRPDVKPIWTGRAMYEEEFERIWNAQIAHYPELLKPEFKNRLQHLMFWQRGISAGTPGKCTFEHDQQRAPRSSLLAQEFRVWQALNNLRVQERRQLERRLTPEERQILFAHLEHTISRRGKKNVSELFGLTFTAVKELLKVSASTKLNLDDEEAGSYLRGNRTLALMVRAFGEERWLGLGESGQRRVVRKWMREQSPEKLRTALREQWGLDPASAEQLASYEPEDGYAALSHQTMLKLLPYMREGLTYAEAVAKVYPPQEAEPLPYLPPLSDTRVQERMGHLPNPAVTRTLAEVRKVVNAIVRTHGRPAQIRIELARSLKQNAEQRLREFKKNKERERLRVTAKAMLKEVGRWPTRENTDRVLLYHQCKQLCVYCGKPLGTLAEVFRDGSGIEVEHILPRRFLDDSLANKVLAHRGCNLEKGDRTPNQAFSHDQGRWHEIVDRVESLGEEGKLKRFHLSEEEALDFSNRHLVDTRTATKLAANYVEMLYGGRDSALPWEDRKRRVYASSGKLTSLLRRHWGLEAVLREPDTAKNGQGGKARTDHRHHAVDAIAIALTSERMVQLAAQEAERFEREKGYCLPRYFPPPWPVAGEIEDRVQSFAAGIKRVVDGIVVSHRPNRKLNGPLHKATYYSPKKGSDVFVRTPVQSLTVKNIESDDVICDAKVRDAVRRKLAEVGKPEKFEAALPMLETKRGQVPIRYVRVRVPGAKAVPSRGRESDPTIFTGCDKGNHHIAIFETEDTKKGPVWYTPGPVPRLEAIRRKKPGMSIVRTQDGRGAKFVFELMQGDMVEMFDKATKRRDLYVFTSMSDGDYAFLRHSKAVPSPKALGLTLGQVRKQMQDKGDRLRITNIDELRVRECKKVEIDSLGTTHYAGTARRRAAVAN